MRRRPDEAYGLGAIYYYTTRECSELAFQKLPTLVHTTYHASARHREHAARHREHVRSSPLLNSLEQTAGFMRTGEGSSSLCASNVTGYCVASIDVMDGSVQASPLLPDELGSGPLLSKHALSC